MMRTRKFIFMAAAIASAMSVFSCAKVEDTITKVEAITFGASFYNDEDSHKESNKTVIEQTESAYKILWEGSDQIAVSGATEAFVITPAITEPSASVTFTGEAVEAPVYYGAYPFSALKAWNGANATMELQKSQPARKGSFASDVNISVSATSADTRNFQFHNVLGYLKFTIGEQSGQITDFAVIAIGQEKLSGEFTVDCSDAEPKLVATADANIFAALSSKEPLAPGDYYLAMFPGTYAKGLWFVVKGPDGVASKMLQPEEGLKLERGKVNTLGTINIENWLTSGPVFDAEFGEGFADEDIFGSDGNMEGFGPEDSFEFN